MPINCAWDAKIENRCRPTGMTSDLLIAPEWAYTYTHIPTQLLTMIICHFQYETAQLFLFSFIIIIIHYYYYYYYHISVSLCSFCVALYFCCVFMCKWFFSNYYYVCLLWWCCFLYDMSVILCLFAARYTQFHI